MTLNSDTVTGNHANAGNGGAGIGGGIYNVPGGTFTSDALTVIADNHASTSGDDIGP